MDQLNRWGTAIATAFTTYLPDTTSRIQAGLWTVIALALVYGLWELIRRRRAPALGEASLLPLPGGELKPGERFKLNGEAVTIGRGEDAALRLKSEAVATRHAAIVGEGSQYWLQDLGSHSGVRLNGRRLGQSTALRDGDVVQVANQCFRFQQERRRAWEPNIWTGFLLLCAGALFFFVQQAAWSTAGPSRPAWNVFAGWTAGLALGACAATLIIRRRRLVVDPVILPVALVLLGIGLTVVLRVRPELYVRQVQAAAIGLVLLVGAALAPLKVLGKYRYLALISGLVLLLATLAAGRVVGDQRLAINIFGFQFQPAEPAKLLLAVFLAGLLSERQELLARSGRGWTLTRSDVRYVGPMVMALVVALGLLIVQRDLGTALLFFGLFVAFLGMASGRVVFVLVSLGAFAFGAVLSAAAFDRVRERVSVWIDPWHDPKGLGYQLSQGLFALAAGGIKGVGLGKGFPFLVPAAHTDLPMAVIGEELGLITTVAVIALLGLLVLRGYRAALRADDDFLGLLAAGLTTVLALQTLVIVGGLVRLLPLTGVTLPFVSFGGTSLVTNFALVGILLGVSATGVRAAVPAVRRSRTRFSWKRQLYWVMATMGAAFAALAGILGYWQSVEAAELTQSPFNPRLNIIAPRLHRGKVIARYGEPLAESLKKEGKYQRYFPEGSLVAGILGYTSRRHGSAGVEGEADPVLQGTRYVKSISGALERAEAGKPGDNVRLTIDLGLQLKAAELLGQRKGSIVAIEPSTGAVRAMVSYPRYTINHVDERWAQLVKDPNRPMVFPAAQGVYPPGSTFKVVTAAVALDRGVVNPSTRFYCPGSGSLGGYTWNCFHGESHGHLSFADALVHSCNVTFGKVGARLGKPALEDGARQLGIGVAPPMGIETSRGLLDPYDEKWGSVPVQIGFGQGPLAVTPLQMALVAACIGNDGVMMKPYLIQDYETPAKQVYHKTAPEVWHRAVKAETARTVRQMMVNVVQRGTGVRAQLPGLQVAGKTGTAENPHGQDHAWFISMAPAQKPKLAIAVLVEGGGQGGKAAAPIARQLYAYYFKIKDSGS